MKVNGYEIKPGANLDGADLTGANCTMTNSITPKVAYIPMEYHMSVEDFLKCWKDMEMEEEPTQEDYNAFVLYMGKLYYDMRGELENYIRLENA